MTRDTGNPDLLCYCAGVRKSDLRAYLHQPGASIEEFIERTGLTKKCTACALDLDLILDEEFGKKPKAGVEVGGVKSDRVGWLTYPNKRIDSGFFLNHAHIRTTLRVGNYFPPFIDERGIANQKYRVSVFSSGGRFLRNECGEIPKGSSLSLSLGGDHCETKHGWFLLSVWSAESAHAGTIRPQVTLKGPDWTSSYHTQFHIYATRSGRRSGVQLRTRFGRTRAGVSIINTSKAPSEFRVTLECGEAFFAATGALPGRGSDIVMIDDLFPDLPECSSVIVRFESEQPTRKNVIFFGEDGRISVDHFPNLI